MAALRAYLLAACRHDPASRLLRSVIHHALPRAQRCMLAVPQGFSTGRRGYDSRVLIAFKHDRSIDASRGNQSVSTSRSSLFEMLGLREIIGEEGGTVGPFPFS